MVYKKGDHISRNISNILRSLTLASIKYLANELQRQNCWSPIRRGPRVKKRKGASPRTKRSVEAVDRRRGESSFIIYGTRANIKFSNCKIDAAYVTLSLSRCRRILLGSHPAAASSATSMPQVSRVPSSFYCKATPHIVQGRVIHFLPDSAQLFINCCSLGEDGTDLSSPRCDTTRRSAVFFF